MFTKTIIILTIIGFIFTNTPISYASTDTLRPQAARESGEARRILDELGIPPITGGADTGVVPVRVLSNIISLRRGAQTGGYNIRHAVSDGADGGIFNHSERRGRIEIAMENMLMSIRDLIDNKASAKTISDRWVNTLRTENLSPAEIDKTLEWLQDFQAQKRDRKTIELLARRIANRIINIQLKEVIDYNQRYPISQSVLCAGETLSQYNAGRTQEVLRQDLEEILEGITSAQARSIGLRIAYEPRWAIGTGKTPTNEEIQKTHRFIKETLRGILGRELEVDYGGSLNRRNSEAILSLPDVDGGLIGGAAKTPEDIRPVIEEAVRQLPNKGKRLNIGMNWKAEDETTGLSPLEDFGNLFQSIRYLHRVQVALGTPQVGTVRSSVTRWLGKIVKIITTVPLLTDYTKRELKGQRAFVRVDFNVSDEQGNIKSNQRIVEAIPTLVYLMRNGATLILASHNGRPRGRVRPEFSMGPVAKELERLLSGYGIRVNFLEGSINEQGLTEGVEDRIVEGAINVLENTRFYAGEEANDEAFAQALARLAHNYLFVFDAFAAGERVHASTGGIAKYMKNIAIGFLMEKEDTYLQGALDRLHGLIIGGGPKVEEKMPVVENVTKNIKEGGFIILGTGPLPAFLKLEGIEIGQKPIDKDIESARGIKKLAEAKGVRLILPTDFIASDKDLSGVAKEEAGGTGKTWLDLKELPPGANIYRVTLEQLRQGTFTDSDTGRQLSAQELYLYDIGAGSQERFRDILMNSPKGSAVFWNGPVGIFEMSVFASGSRGIAQGLAEATKNGVDTVIGGGDTVAAAEQFGVDTLVTHSSTGGGASAAVLQGKKLAVTAELERQQGEKNKTILAAANELNIDREMLSEYIKADRAIYTALAGVAFSGYINRLGNIRTQEKGQALVIAPGFFRVGGAISALEEVAELKGIRVALYGEDAQKMKTLLANENIVTGRDLNEVLENLLRLGFSAQNTLLVRSPKDELDRGLNIRQVVSGDISTLALAKAIKELLGDVAGSAFADFSQKMADMEVISPKAYSDNREALLAKLVEAGVFTFPEDLTETEKVTAQTEEEQRTIEEFMDRV